MYQPSEKEGMMTFLVKLSRQVSLVNMVIASHDCPLHSDTRWEMKESRVHNGVKEFMALTVGNCMCISFMFLLPNDGTKVSCLYLIRIDKLYSAYF
jgi:hypothetical protein